MSSSASTHIHHTSYSFILPCFSGSMTSNDYPSPCSCSFFSFPRVVLSRSPSPCCNKHPSDSPHLHPKMASFPSTHILTHILPVHINRDRDPHSLSHFILPQTSARIKNPPTRFFHISMTVHDHDHDHDHNHDIANTRYQNDPSPPGLPLTSRQRWAIETIQKVYGDAEDESMEYRRWVYARDAATRFSPVKNQNLVYGELNLVFFFRLLNVLNTVQSQQHKKNKVFVDIGSGVGRLVMSVAVANSSQEWRLCRGVEILKELHDIGKETERELRSIWSSHSPDPDTKTMQSLESPNSTDCLCPCEFIHGKYQDLSDLEMADVCFCYATTWGSDPFKKVLEELSLVLGSRLTTGAHAVTVDKLLDVNDGFQLLAQIDGFNQNTDSSTGYIWRKI